MSQDHLTAFRTAPERAAVWQAAAFRAVHPVRWFVGAVGVVLTLAVCAAALAVFEGSGVQVDAWRQDPLGELTRLGQELVSENTAVTLWRAYAVGLPLYLLWSVLGGWFARWELLAQQRLNPHVSRADEASIGRLVGFVGRRLTSFVGSVFAVAVFAGIAFLPGLVAGYITRIPVLGPLFVAAMLPIVLIGGMMLVLVSGAAACQWLAPAAIACEAADTFEAISRSFSYFFQAPFSFLWREVVALTIAALPLAGAIYLGATGRVEERLPVLLLAAAGLSFSCFWGLQAVVYQAMRRIIDGSDEDEVYLEVKDDTTRTPPRPAETPDAKKPSSEPARTGPLNRAFTYVLMVAVVGGAWVVTCDAISYWGGDQGRWVRWGMDGRLKPEAEGVLWAASLIAAFWGVSLLGFLLLGLLRPAFRRR